MSNQKDSNNQSDQSSATIPFKGVVISIFSVLLLSNVGQILFEYCKLNYPIWAGGTAVAALFILWLLLFGRKTFEAIQSVFFTVCCLLPIGIATALGSFIDQNKTNSIYTEQYSENGSGLISSAGLDNLYHSSWFVSLFVLLVINLLFMAFKRKLTIINLPYHLACLGPILIVGGFWIDGLLSYQGLMVLGTEESSNQVRIMEKNTLLEDVALELPFNITLNKLTAEEFDSTFYIQLWKEANDSANKTDQEEGSELITTIGLENGIIHHIYNTNIYYRLNDFFPNFGFKYEYPADIDTISPDDPGVMLEMMLPSGRAQLQLRTIVKNTLQEPHLNANLEFYWERPQDLVNLTEISLSEWRNSTNTLTKIIFIADEEKVLYVSDTQYASEQLTRDKEYLIPGKEPMGFKFQFFFPDAKYMTAIPGSIDEEIKNPVAKVEVWGTDWAKSELAYIYPSAKNKGGFFQIPKYPYSIGLGTNYSKANKFIQSDITLSNENDDDIKHGLLSRNSTLSHNGYKLTQYKIQENNPKSVILSVAYLPGYSFVMIGCLVLLLSCFAGLINHSTTIMINKNSK